jgi:hypothetical protein
MLTCQIFHAASGVQMASRAQKASVEPAEIQRYERYNTKHGAKLTSSEDGEEEEDDW